MTHLLIPIISNLYSKLNLSQTTVILISLCIMLFAGFLVTRLTKLLKLPNVTGFIIAGIIIGPSVLGLIPKNIITNMGFVSDIALTFIAFGVGRFFTTQVLKKSCRKTVLITFIEALITFVLMLVLLKFILNLSWTFSLILSTMAMATAPASTMMTIQQYKAKGDFVETMLQVIAFDNVICLLLFGIVSSLVSATDIGSVNALDVILPILYNLASIVIGIFLGFILGKLLAVPTRSKDNRLILVVSMLLGLAGLCTIVNISPLLSCMVFGATYINYTKDNYLYKQITKFTPPIMSIFFVLGGMNLSFSSLKLVGLIGIAYAIIRILGKYVGSFIGCKIVKAPKTHQKFLGMALVPQAGVAVGLAFLAQRILPIELGQTVLTIILASSVLFELIGPASAKASLFLSGSIPKDVQPEEYHKTEDTSIDPIIKPMTFVIKRKLEKATPNQKVLVIKELEHQIKMDELLNKNENNNK